MSECHFGLGNGKVSQHTIKKVQKVAETHGATFVTYRDPSSGPRYWFSSRNYGSPFDQATADAVIMELTNIGLWPIPIMKNH